MSEPGTQVFVTKNQRGRWEVTAKDRRLPFATFPHSQKDQAVDFAREQARRLRSATGQ